MQDILNKLEALYNECAAKKASLDAKLSQVQDTITQQKELAEKLKQQRDNLAEREKGLEKIEDLIQYRKDADTRMEQAKATIAEYDKRVNNFATYENAIKKDLNGRKELLDRRENTINEKERNLESLILEKVRSILKK